MATKKGSSKKAGAKGAAKAAAGKKAAASKLSTGTVRKLGQSVQIEQLGITVGEAINRALAAQGGGLLKGTIIAGIIYDLKSQSFKPVFKQQ
jgi:hypothetical protein